MKNKITLTLIFIFVQFFLFAQNSIVKVDYEESAVGSNFIFQLKIADQFSYYSYIKPANDYKGEGNSIMVDDSNIEAPLYKEYNTQKMYSKEYILSTSFLVVDSLNIQKWSLNENKKTILGKKCLGASTFFRGRNYEVYYCPELVFNDGPWKFSGLPGLILEATSEDNKFKFTALNIVIEKFDRSLPKNKENFIKGNVFVNYKEYKIKFVNHINRMIEGDKAAQDNNVEATSYFKLDLPEIIYPELQSGNGIKY